MKRSIICAITVFWIPLCLNVPMILAQSREGDSAHQAKKSEELKKALVESARDTFKMTWQRFLDLEHTNAEGVNLWSCRLLDAQLDAAGNPENAKAAFRDHLERMKDLERAAAGNVGARQYSKYVASQAQFFRIQAELWALNGKRK